MQVGNGSQQYASDSSPATLTTLTPPGGEADTDTDDSQPQPLTDLNPSAGNFAAVRNRFEQLSVRSGGDTNGSETLTTPTPLNQGTVKRLSGNFEDPPTLVQKSFVHIAAPELSEGALSRTVIISSLQLERNDNSVPGGGVPGVGPESPVPNLEPPC